MKPSVTLVLSLTLIFSATFNPSPIQPADREAKRVAPIRHLPGHEERKREADAERDAMESGLLTPSQEEAALAPTQRAPTIANGFAGMNFTDSPSSVPPDTIAATGPNHIVEVVNSAIAFFDRTSGAAVGSTPELLGTFFSPLGTNASSCIFDPVVAYDDIAGRFYIGALDVPEVCGDTPTNTAMLLYAVSNTSDPTAGFTEMHAIDVDEPKNSACPTSQTVGGDFTRTGWNADAHVFALNMFGFTTGCFDHVAVITIDKSKVLDANNTTFTFSHTDRTGTSNASMVPATMHGSGTGDPMWFVEESVSANTIRVVKMTNVLGNPPTFAETDLAVTSYNSPPSATQKGGGRFIDSGDSRILNVEWRDDRLVAAHTVGIFGMGTANARWYEFDTSSTPSLTQQGTISRGSGIHTYYPSIAIAEIGDLGMTFMESSSAEFMSMYVTGQQAGDAPGTMQTPKLAKAGARNYNAFDCDGIPPGESNVCRAGDYSGITVDPNFTDRFCAANEYATSASSENWGTWLTCFSLLSGHDLAVTKMTAPKSVTGSGAMVVPIAVTIQNRSDHNETIMSSDLGNGVSTGLVRLNVSAIDNDGESCQTAVVALNGAANAALFSLGSKVLLQKQSMTVNFSVTLQCQSAQPKSKTDPSPGDYNYTATVHHEVLGGSDAHPDDDTCPHAALFDPNPPPKGTKDKGCGGKSGTPVVTDVVQ
jgi:hypothetical protein